MIAAKHMRSGERSVLIMLVACLAVIACAGAVFVVDHRQDRREQIRARGISLVRLLAGLPGDELADERTYRQMLRVVSFSQGADDFAYAALVNGAGLPLAEVSAPGVIVPEASVPADPTGWIGERGLVAAGRPVIEYYAPIFDAEAFVGQIRLGFFEPGFLPLYNQVPILGGLALLIFLLTPLSYYLLRREIRPLGLVGAELERRLGNDDSGAESPAGWTSASFVDRFNRYVEASEKRVRELETDRDERVVSEKLIAYRSARVELILQALPDAVLVLDEHGTITYANRKACSLLEATKDQMLTTPPADWCKQPEIAAFLADYRTTSQSYLTDTVTIPVLLQTERTLAINGYPLFASEDSSHVHGTLVVVRDVTREALAQTSRAEFVAHLGHELKTPLNTLSLYSETLLEGDDLSASERIEAVNAIRDEVERLTGLISNLLSITRIEMGSFDLDRKRVSIREFLNDIASSVGRSGRHNGVKIDVQIDAGLDAMLVDKDLLRVAINNLVSNAIKYNRPGGTVEISAEDVEDAITITVRDSGIGIAPEDCERIFEKFFRSDDDEVRERSGHGLGLPLARQIVALHDGALTVESEPGKGSAFTIALWKRSGLDRKAI